MSRDGKEYRVSWQRNESSRRHRIFATLAAAQRLADNLTYRDNRHWKCDEAHNDCLEPIVVGPTVEERRVLPWHPLTVIPR